MRVLIRLDPSVPASCRHITLDMPEGDNVADVKQCVVDSQQVSLQPEEMLLYDNGELLEDHTTVQQLIQKNGICTYAVLTRRRRGVSPLLGGSRAGTIFPAPGSTNVRLNMSICVVLATEARVSNPNDAIEVRGPKDYFCCGQVECDVEPGATILTFKPRGLYVPGGKYTVRVRAAAIEHDPAVGGEPQVYSDEVWTFEAAAVPPLRLLAAERSDPQEQVLVTVPRHSCSMLTELRTVLAARFDCAVGCVCDIETTRGGKRVVIASDVDVYELKEGDSVTFAKSTEPRPVEQEVDMPYDLKYDSYLDYVKDHFANWRCGFWAVCGKMTYEEEMSIINALIEAEESAAPEQVATAASAPAHTQTQVQTQTQPATPASSSEDLIPLENIRHPHWVLVRSSDDLLHPQLNTDAVPLFAASALADPSMRSEIVRTWHRRQYVMLELPPELDASCREVQSAGQQFFLLPSDVKLQCVDDRERYLGYAERPAFHKELFQVRRTFVPDPAHWPTATPSLKTAATANYDAMEALCHDMLSLACSELGFSDEYVAQLKEHPGDAGNGVVSMSNLTLFKYGLEGKTVDWLHLPYHTDIGLVTIIPRAMGAGGLHVYDWVLGSWVDVEATIPEGFALAFGGEALTFLTQGYIGAALHDVSHVRGVRISTPFQCLPAAGSRLDRSQMDVARAKALSPDFEPCATHEGMPDVMDGQQFVHKLSSQRVSTNFPRHVEPQSTSRGRDVFHQAQPSQQA